MGSQKNSHVVVGGGISGLLAALMLAESKCAQPVYLVERESDIGGLLRCFDYGEFGRFDYGMHNMYETGVPALDELLLGILPDSEWQYLKGNKRDLAGLFFNGRLQLNSLYMDLRSLPSADYERCLGGFFANLGVDRDCAPVNAKEFADWRFGRPIADAAVIPAIQKIFKRDAAEMDTMAAMLTSLDRVIMFDEPRMRDLMSSQLIGSRIAYTEQRNLPAERSSGRMGYYPKKYGMYRVIDALRKRLLAAGVQILTNAKVTRVGRNGSGISSVDISLENQTQTIEGIAALHWTAGIPALAPLLDIPLKGIVFDRPLQTVAVNLVLGDEPDMGDLYYFYCYDQGYDTFRVTHFSAYCDGARRAGGTPVCVELLVEPPPAGMQPDYVAQALKELEHFGVISPRTRPLFAGAEPLAYGFPMPSLRNIGGLGALRDRITELDLSNLQLLGILAEPRLFFQKDVVAHTHAKISALMGQTR